MQKWLIVDDDADDRDIFQVALTDVDPSIELLQAGNGLEALNLLRATKKPELPDLIFMDINMPNMDGKECLKELKKDPDLKHITVMMYTTSSAEMEKDSCFKLGASSYITKPTDIMQLITILKEIANSKAAKKG